MSSALELEDGLERQLRVLVCFLLLLLLKMY